MGRGLGDKIWLGWASVMDGDLMVSAVLGFEDCVEIDFEGASLSFAVGPSSSKSIPAIPLLALVSHKMLLGGAVVANTMVFADAPSNVR